MRGKWRGVCLIACLLFIGGASCRADLAWSSGDVGSPGVAGSTSINSSTDTFTIQGAGTQIGGTSDSFQYAYASVSGYVEVAAQVVSQTNTNAAAPAGLMFRQSLSDGTAYAMISVTPSNGVVFSTRTQAGNSSATTTVSALHAPIWLRLVRNGTIVSGYRSSNGSNWTLVGSVNFSSGTLFSGSSFYAGLAVCSSNVTTLGAAVFNNVSVRTNLPQTGTNLKLWLRSDVGVTVSGSAVTSWADQSGNAMNGSQSVAANRPTFAFDDGGDPVVRFNGLASYLQLTGGTQAYSDVTIFVVPTFQDAVESGSGGMTLLSKDNGPGNTNKWIYWWPGSSMELHINSTSAGPTFIDSSSFTPTTGSRYVTEIVKQGTSFTHYINGENYGQTTSGTTIPSISTNIHIGEAEGGNHFHGDIAEVLIYNRALTDVERQGVESYLAQKYGLTFTAAPSLPPVFSPAGGVYSGPQSVTITANNNAQIYYTLDGSTPTTGSTPYAGAISIADTTTVRAIAVVPGLEPSVAAGAAYVIDNDASGVSRTSLQGWYRSDGGVITGAADAGIGQWLDVSGQSMNASQAASANRPLFAEDSSGMPVVRFDGTSSYLEAIGGTQQYSDMTIFAVPTFQAPVEPGTLGMPLVSKDDGEGSMNKWIYWYPEGGWYPSGGLDLHINTTAAALSDAYSSSFAPTAGTRYVTEFVKQGTSFTHYIDGENYGQTISGATIPSISTNIHIGEAEGFHFHGDIAEVLIYNRALTDVERQGVESYLAQKYGLTFTGAPSLPPSLSPAGGVYSVSQSVAITANNGAQIYYTLDGSAPTTGSTLYAGAISIASTTTVRAIAVVPGLEPSAEADAAYVIDSGASGVSRTGLQGWYRGDGGVITAGGAAGINLWLDVSGHAMNASQATSANRPLFAVDGGGKSVVRFDGTSSYLEAIGGTQQYSDMTIFVVPTFQAMVESGSGGLTLLSKDDGPGATNKWIYWWPGSNMEFHINTTAGAAAFIDSSSFSPASGTRCLTEFVKQGTSYKFFVNGTGYGTTTSSATIPSISTNIHIGEAEGGNHFHGDVAEVLIYNRALSTAERQAVESYLKTKYGL